MHYLSRSPILPDRLRNNVARGRQKETRRCSTSLIGFRHVQRSGWQVRGGQVCPAACCHNVNRAPHISISQAVPRCALFSVGADRIAARTAPTQGVSNHDILFDTLLHNVRIGEPRKVASNSAACHIASHSIDRDSTGAVPGTILENHRSNAGVRRTRSKFPEQTLEISPSGRLQ